MRSFLLASLALALPHAPPDRPAIAHGAYVWQRAADDVVDEAVREAPGGLGTIVTLAAELEVDAKGARLARAPLRTETHRARGKGVGLAVRVHQLPGDRMLEGVAPVELLDVVQDTVRRAREARLEPTELQLDFDCPTGHLAAYASWLPSLRREAGEIPLTVTALPTWLGSSAGEALLRDVPGFVLQVHGLEVRGRGDARIFDRAAARSATVRAGALGVPFRVSLPTYAYGLRYAGARLVDVTSEDGDDEADVDVPLDAGEVAAFVRWAERRRPSSLGGLLWFRLPVAGDRRAFSREALSQVMRGESPGTRVRAEVVREGDVATIEIVNDGVLAAHDVVTGIRWEGALDAADGLAGPLVDDGPSASTVRVAWLAPGARRRVAWLRAGGRVDAVVR